jgi:hypothetical protein
MGLDNGYGLGIGSLKPGVCTSTTRPASPFEGQMVYETDTDMVAIWNGSAWRYISATTPTNGTVLQVVTTSDVTTRSTTSDYPVASGFSASITPKSSSSKILVSVTTSMQATGGSNANKIVLIGISYGAGSTTSIFRTRVSAAPITTDWFMQPNMFILHEPATTSSCTYNLLYGRYSSGFDNTCIMNGDAGGGVTGRSTITLMEIAG